MEIPDLNRLDGPGLPEQPDYSCVSGSVEVVFRNHIPRLLDLLEEARKNKLVCFGAVAWLTEQRVLEAMAKLSTSILIQKEDWLRPDLLTPQDSKDAGFAAWKRRLRRLYDAVGDTDRYQPDLCHHNMPLPLGNMCLKEVLRITGIRCFGLLNDRGRNKNRRPLMHNKFLVCSELGLVPVPGCEEERS